jgi:hypothetical protein
MQQGSWALTTAVDGAACHTRVSRPTPALVSSWCRRASRHVSRHQETSMPRVQTFLANLESSHGCTT